MFHSANCLEGRWGQSSGCSKTPLRTTSSTCSRKGSLGTTRTGPVQASAWLMRTHRAHYLEGKAAMRYCIHRTVKAGMAGPSGINWHLHGDKECFSRKEEALPNNRSVSLNLLRKGLSVAFRAEQLLLARGSLASKFKCTAVIWDNR